MSFQQFLPQGSAAADEEILRLGSLLETLNADMEGATDDEADVLGVMITVAERRISELPASRFSTLLIKMKIATDMYAPGGNESTDEACLLSAVGDLVRLSAEETNRAGTLAA